MADDSRSPADGTSTEDRYVVVSIDSHVGPSVKDQLRDYCEAKYLDDFDRFVTEMESQGLLHWRSSEATKAGAKESWSLGKSLAERGKAQADKPKPPTGIAWAIRSRTVRETGGHPQRRPGRCPV